MIDKLLAAIDIDSTSCAVAVIGPVVCQSSDGTSARVWYFTAALPEADDFQLG